MKTTFLPFYSSIIGISAISFSASAVVMNHRPFGHDQDGGSDLYLGPADSDNGGGSSTDEHIIGSSRVDIGPDIRQVAGSLSKDDLALLEANSAATSDDGARHTEDSPMD